MTCEEARTHIHFHLDGEDHHHHVKKARAHTAECTYCEQHVSDLREVEAELRSLRKYAAPEGLKERILMAVQDMPQKRPLSRKATGGLWS